MAKYINYKGEERIVEINQVYFVSEGIVIEWSGSAGWGECTIYFNPDENCYNIDDECMGREFVQALLSDFFKNYMKIDSEVTSC